MPNETATECADCYKPECAKAIASCDAISGLQQTFVYFDIFEAPYALCGDQPINDDACVSPPSCVAGAAQCGTEPQRWAMRLHGMSTSVRSVKRPGLHPDWGLLDACPHLHRSVSNLAGAACWDQLSPGTTSMTLRYAAQTIDYTAALPSTFAATCNHEAVPARYQFLFLACAEGATECSDELIDCPTSADLGRKWWEPYAELLAISSVSDATSFTTPLSASMAQVLPLGEWGSVAGWGWGSVGGWDLGWRQGHGPSWPPASRRPRPSPAP